jgi:hypothetical protein
MQIYLFQIREDEKLLYFCRAELFGTMENQSKPKSFARFHIVTRY